MPGMPKSSKKQDRVSKLAYLHKDALALLYWQLNRVDLMLACNKHGRASVLRANSKNNVSIELRQQESLLLQDAYILNFSFNLRFGELRLTCKN